MTSEGVKGIMNSAIGTILESGWPCGNHDPSGSSVGMRIAPGPKRHGGSGVEPLFDASDAEDALRVALELVAVRLRSQGLG